MTKCRISVRQRPDGPGYRVFVNGERPSGWTGFTVFHNRSRARRAGLEWCEWARLVGERPWR